MSDQAVKIYKEHNKTIFNPNKSFNKNDIELDFSDKSTIYNSIEDAISILDVNLNILSVNFTMRTWYPGRKSFIGKKCFYVYHNRKEPCENCPVIRTLNTGVACLDIIPYHIKSTGSRGWHELQSYPILEDGRVVGVAEYVKDITKEVNLYSKISDFESSLEDFKEQNRLLRMYLEQVQEEKDHISANISDNIKKYIKPLVKQLKNTCNERPLEYDLVSLLETLFSNIVTPYIEGSSALEGFTSREIQIMSMIKNGRTSKEIADAMSVNTKTVDFHRANIRKKLGLERTDNLRSYLIRSRIAFD